MRPLFYSLIFLISASYGNAATYFVAKTGNNSNPCSENESTPKLTISGTNGGISCLKSGDTLEIKTGTYTDIIPQAAIPAGFDWDRPTTIKTYKDHVVTLTCGGAGIGHYNANQSYIVWDGFIFDVRTNFVIGNGAHHIRVTNFELKNSVDNGFIFEAGSGFNQITHGSIHDTGSNPSGPPHGFYIGSDNNLFEYLDVYNSLNGYGIQLYDGGSSNSHDNIIRNSKVHNNARAGICLSDGTGSKVYNNLVYRNNEHGIMTWHNAGSAAIYNNTVFGNGSVGGGYGIYIVFSDTTSVAIKNNIAYQNVSGQYLDDGTGTIQSNNLFSANPQFVNASAGDFHLQSSSPAINAGLPLSEVLFDFEGTPRPQGSAFDIGAYEFKSGTIATRPNAPTNFRVQ